MEESECPECKNIIRWGVGHQSLCSLNPDCAENEAGYLAMVRGWIAEVR